MFNNSVIRVKHIHANLTVGGVYDNKPSYHFTTCSITTGVANSEPNNFPNLKF